MKYRLRILKSLSSIKIDLAMMLNCVYAILSRYDPLTAKQ